MERIVSRVAKVHMAPVNPAETQQSPLEIISKLAAPLLTVTRLVSGPRTTENG